MAITTSGNVGIGTWLPTSLLQVGTVPTSGVVQSGTVGQTAVYGSSSANVSGSNNMITSGTTTYFNQGNVGIGTRLPSEKLNVTNGNIGIGTTLSAGYLRMYDSAGVLWKCQPAPTTGVFTCS